MARNARFVLNPSRVRLIATGNVSAAIDWQVQVASGAPRPQRRDEVGQLLWIIDAIDESDPEASRASVVAVEVASPVIPVPEKYQPLDLSAAEVSLYVGKTGQLNITYSAALKGVPKVQAA